jgi:uncharacterized protein YfaS (alpha-2-macroglobulin family)
MAQQPDVGTQKIRATMNQRFFGGLDISKDGGAFCLWDKKRMTVVVIARTPFAIRFWLLACKRMGIQVFT